MHGLYGSITYMDEIRIIILITVALPNTQRLHMNENKQTNKQNKSNTPVFSMIQQAVYIETVNEMKTKIYILNFVVIIQHSNWFILTCKKFKFTN